MKRELNFRLGKGRATERKKAFSAKSVIACFRFLGMTDDEIKAKMESMRPAPTRDEGGRDGM